MNDLKPDALDYAVLALLLVVLLIAMPIAVGRAWTPHRDGKPLLLHGNTVREMRYIAQARELLAEIHREREEARRAWQEVRAGVAHNANHSNWPGGLITHPEGSLEIDVVPEVSAAARSGYPWQAQDGLQTQRGPRFSTPLREHGLLDAF